MKYKVPFLLLVGLIIMSSLAWPIVQHQKETARRRTLSIDIPQAERAFRVPSQQRIRESLTASAQEILEQSPQLTLFSVKPRESFGYAKHAFHDHEILGQTSIRDLKAKADLLASFYDGLVPVEKNAISFGCFNPRHGLRAVHQGKTLDLLICFSCRHFNAYVNGKAVEMSCFITNSPQPRFNQILTTAHIPISK